MNEDPLLPPPPTPMPTDQQPGVTVCPQCGARGTLRAQQGEITRKRRVKFGLTWLLITIFTGGIGLLLWLVWPRRNEVISVDRWTECTACKMRT